MRRLAPVAVALAVAGCGGAPTGGDDLGGDDAARAPDAQAVRDAADPPDLQTVVDLDGDGLDDRQELAWADDYYPFLSIDPGDGCKVHGVLFRLSPHPMTSALLANWNDVLYDADCGAAGHDGDDEVFGVLADPGRAGPAGILAVVAISHQGTLCQQVTTCGGCAWMSACATATRKGAPYPVVFPSRDKHGNYADKATCDSSFLCDPGCTLAADADAPPLVNAGEPGKPLVTDLTTQGFVTAANGWTHMELFHFDPWQPGNFGGAGDVSKDLVDSSFVIDPTGCP